MKIKSAWHALELTLEQWIQVLCGGYVSPCELCGYGCEHCPIGVIMPDACIEELRHYWKMPNEENCKLVISAIMGIMEIWNNRYVHKEWYTVKED